MVVGKGMRRRRAWLRCQRCCRSPIACRAIKLCGLLSNCTLSPCMCISHSGALNFEMVLRTPTPTQHIRVRPSRRVARGQARRRHDAARRNIPRLPPGLVWGCYKIR